MSIEYYNHGLIYVGPIEKIILSSCLRDYYVHIIIIINYTTNYHNFNFTCTYYFILNSSILIKYV